MSKQFIVRPTNMAAALVDAAVKSMKVDHKPDGTAKNWIAKRVVNNCDKDGCGVVREPAFNARLSLKTAKKLGLAG